MLPSQHSYLEGILNTSDTGHTSEYCLKDVAKGSGTTSYACVFQWLHICHIASEFNFKEIVLMKI